MTKKEFQELLEKHENGLCTSQEEKLLNQFLDSFQRPADNTNWSEREQKETGERIFQKVNQRISTSNTTTFSIKTNWLWWTLAALLIGFGVYWAVQIFNEREKTQKEGAPVIYANVTTKENERKELKLSDGTLITLNENSTLKYPKTFLPEGERKVKLSGEAFFEVAKDSLRPFIALSGNIETIVLGTTFNINARPEAEITEVALVEGKVQIGTREKEKLEVLVPNEQFTFSKKNKTTRKSSFKGNLTYAWKEEVILFEKASVREVIEVLSEKYDAVFQIEDEEGIESLLVYRVNTEKYQLSQILKHITKVTDYRFTKNADGSITVKPK
ncbi:MAG: hypothetical protein GVX78_03980 [Bacteroidetes bacterium]|jgi:ferric-dicitrate binding protein FerR (iron transport regulator)|nr:hypothetical protein [Bacteroidota bacterium]